MGRNGLGILGLSFAAPPAAGTAGQTQCPLHLRCQRTSFLKAARCLSVRCICLLEADGHQGQLLKLKALKGSRSTQLCSHTCTRLFWWLKDCCILRFSNSIFCTSALNDCVSESWTRSSIIALGQHAQNRRGWLQSSRTILSFLPSTSSRRVS